MWRIPPNLALMRSILPSFEEQLAYMQSQLLAAASGPVDQLYSRVGLMNGVFFPQGWGDLSVVNLQEDLKVMQAWPPPGIKVDWKCIDSGTKEGTAFKLYEGTFKTPCIHRIYDALPPESRTARVQFLVPDRPSTRRLISTTTTGHLADAGTGRPLSAAIHLAATGDQGFSRRLNLAFPLLSHGVCSLVLESPFYGSRRPAAQKGSKLLKVSDLLSLGWATIYESVNLLYWLANEGFDEGGLCMAGLSMGGVHSCMTSALYPGEVATAALLAPRSAAVAYCDGALSAAMAWQPFLAEADEANNEVLKVINNAAQPVSVMREATYALAELELAWEMAGNARRHGSKNPSVGSDAAPASAVEGAGSSQQTGAATQHDSGGGEGEQQGCPVEAAEVEAYSNVAAWLRAGGLQPADGSPAGSGGQASSSRSGPAGSHSRAPHADHTHHHTNKPSATPTGHAHHTKQASASSFIGTLQSAPHEVGPRVKELFKGLSELKLLSLADGSMERQKTLRRLKHVLETYTDITRFPRPRRPDAGIFVAATHDQYVTIESVSQLQRYWEGSEMRLVSGGHVTAFLMHQDKFRQAILDSITRLKQPQQHQEDQHQASHRA